MGDQEYNSGKKYRQKGTLCGPNIPPNSRCCMSSGNVTLNQSLDTDSDHVNYSSSSSGRYCPLAF
jgi:hypothetical protein